MADMAYDLFVGHNKETFDMLNKGPVVTVQLESPGLGEMHPTGSTIIDSIMDCLKYAPQHGGIKDSLHFLLSSGDASLIEKTVTEERGNQQSAHSRGPERVYQPKTPYIRRMMSGRK